MAFKDSVTHPSFGQVQFSRTTGGRSRLYGSALRKHGDSIRLRIVRSEMSYELGRTWYFGKGKPLIEVELSAAQFAELLTTMNVGSGVPCTIKALDGKLVEPLPDDEPLEHERVGKEFVNDGEYAQRINGAVDSAEQKLKGMLEQKVVKKGDVQAVLNLVEIVRREIKSNLPFMLDQFREAAEKVKTTVMAEADAWLTSAVQRAGFKALGWTEKSAMQLIDGITDENQHALVDFGPARGEEEP